MIQTGVAADAIDIANSGSGHSIDINTTTGIGGTNNSLKITHISSSPAVNIANTGSSSGLHIANSNPSATEIGVNVIHMADTPAVFIDNAGNSKGVSIFNGSPAGTGEGLEVIQAGSASALLVDNGGSGKGAHILTMDPANDESVITASTMGTGPVGMFSTEDNNANLSPTIIAVNRGTGNTAVFDTSDEATGKVNLSPTVVVTSNGKGSALDVSITNSDPGGDANITPAITARHEGLGQVVHVEGLASSNFKDVVEIINKTSGIGLHVDSFDNLGVNVKESLYVEQSNPSTVSVFGRTAVFDQHAASTLADSAVLIRSAATTSSNSALRVIPSDPTKQAADFEGNVDIASDLVVGDDVTVGSDITIGGMMSAAAKAFKIDHPLDPENKYLIHNSIESNERINIYSGNIKTDDQGYAMIQLPDYMNALNKDFKYQLTIVDKTFAQAIIWEPMNVNTNSFTIKTNEPNIKVSWQITGTRQDTWAKENPMKVEIQKNATY